MAKPAVTPLTPKQVEQVKRLKTGLNELRQIFEELGPIPRSLELFSLSWVLHGFSLAAMQAMSPPKKPRKPRPSKDSVTDGWIGG